LDLALDERSGRRSVAVATAIVGVGVWAVGCGLWAVGCGLSSSQA
jgi:hypothetical protein